MSDKFFEYRKAELRLLETVIEKCRAVVNDNEDYYDVARSLDIENAISNFYRAWKDLQ